MLFRSVTLNWPIVVGEPNVPVATLSKFSEKIVAACRAAPVVSKAANVIVLMIIVLVTLKWVLKP